MEAYSTALQGGPGAAGMRRPASGAQWHPHASASSSPTSAFDWQTFARTTPNSANTFWSWLASGWRWLRRKRLTLRVLRSPIQAHHHPGDRQGGPHHHKQREMAFDQDATPVRMASPRISLYQSCLNNQPPHTASRGGRVARLRLWEHLSPALAAGLFFLVSP